MNYFVGENTKNYKTALIYHLKPIFFVEDGTAKESCISCCVLKKIDFKIHYNIFVQQGTKLWIATEYVDGCSALDLRKAGPLSENDIAVILRDVLKGLDYLHSKRRVHRDVKGDFILFKCSMSFSTEVLSTCKKSSI